MNPPGTKLIQPIIIDSCVVSDSNVVQTASYIYFGFIEKILNVLFGDNRKKGEENKSYDQNI